MTLKDLSTLHKKDLKTEATKKRKKSILKWRFFGSALTVALSLCVFQLSWSTIYSITKIGFYKNKIRVSQKKLEEAHQTNIKLKDEKNNFSQETLEEMAKNDLKLAPKNSILLILYNDEEEQKEPKTLWERILKFTNDSFNFDSENLTWKKTLVIV